MILAMLREFNELIMKKGYIYLYNTEKAPATFDKEVQGLKIKSCKGKTILNLNFLPEE